MHWPRTQPRSPAHAKSTFLAKMSVFYQQSPEMLLKHCADSLALAKSVASYCEAAKHSVEWLTQAAVVEKNVWNALHSVDGLIEFLRANRALDKCFSSSNSFLTLASLIDFRLSLASSRDDCYETYWPILRLVMQQVDVSANEFQDAIKTLEQEWLYFRNLEQGNNTDKTFEQNADAQRESKMCVLRAFGQLESICDKQSRLELEIKQLL